MSSSGLFGQQDRWAQQQEPSQAGGPETLLTPQDERIKSMCEGKKGCLKPENLKGKPEACPPEQIEKYHGDQKVQPMRGTVGQREIDPSGAHQGGQFFWGFLSVTD